MSTTNNYQNYNANTTVEQVNSNISNGLFRLKQNVNQLNKLKKQLGTSKDSDKIRNNIHNIFQKSNEILKEITSNFKKLSSFNTSESEIALTKSKRAFENELESYSRLQKEIADKIRLTPLVNYEDQNNAFEENESEGFDERQTLLKQKKLSELDEKIDMVRDRENKMRQIETDIIDINAIMSDLATMVHEQSSLVDNITSNVESTSANVHYANDNLVKASRYATKYRKKLVFLILIIVIVMITLGLILYLTIKH
ncbi:unnamed protein product [Brachionus calyciflorus]|uniref:t-SNARE coiled-coil homology domain-containing protein n=1 Tax=Brachionus calyciflorus TaxID=104777 RepID=A0A813M2U2_9BILA|nr:unnamed protein product [Brachionus calyciflorus]